MDSSKIKAIIVAILAIFAALYLGVTAATAQLETAAWVIGGVGLVTCLLLGKRIYLLIPFMSSLGLVIPLPGSFNTAIIAQACFLAFATLLFLSRRLPVRGGISELEVWCLLLIMTVVQAYVRNPVGINLFGSDSIGAKAYAIFAITTLCAMILSVLSINPNDLRLWARLSFLGSILNFVTGALGLIFPQFGYFLGASFSTDVNNKDEVDQSAIGVRATRVSFVRPLSTALANWISSKISPLRASFHPLWAPFVILAFLLAGISGYRSQLITVGLFFLIGIFYRGGIKSVAASVTLGATGLILLAFVNLIAPLPINIQRTLTFLPGTWDQALMDESEDSTDWRIGMWKDALLTDRWIQDKWLGDGLGFTKQEYERMLNFREAKVESVAGRSGLTYQQESMMISGTYHSGPVQTIRTTGYLGLAVMLFAMIRVAMHAHGQILRTRGTEWYPATLFLCIPLIATPIIWTFIFGTFEEGTTGILMGVAIVRLLEKNLPLPAYVTKRRGIYILKRQHKSSNRII